MTMYSEMTLSQKLGLTPEATEERKTATLKELSEMGFVNLPKSNWTATCEAVDEQIENDTELADKVFNEVCDYYADVGVCKENYEQRLEQWVEEKVNYLFPNE